jgi:hypothetical protein
MKLSVVAISVARLGRLGFYDIAKNKKKAGKKATFLSKIWHFKTIYK